MATRKSAKGDWREPFLRLKEGLYPLFDTGLQIHHCVALSPDCTQEVLAPLFKWFEPACRGNKLLKTISVETEGCRFHGHFFYAEGPSGLNQLGRLLDGLENWIDALPPRFVPSFAVPQMSSQVERNIVRWTSLVYYLAWASEAVYLEAEVEHLAIGEVLFLPSNECPQPPGWDPRPWLIHQSTAASGVDGWRSKFERRGERFPDLIDAYLTNDLVFASLAAIDVLAYVLHGERKRSAAKSRDYAKPLDHTRCSKKVQVEVEDLKRFLANWHSPNKPLNADIDQDRDFCQPLTAEQIAERRGWVTPKGKPDTTKVSRRMELIFGKDPMETYRARIALACDRDPRIESLSDGSRVNEPWTPSTYDRV